MYRYLRIVVRLEKIVIFRDISIVIALHSELPHKPGQPASQP